MERATPYFLDLSKSRVVITGTLVSGDIDFINKWLLLIKNDFIEKPIISNVPLHLGFAHRCIPQLNSQMNKE